MAKIRLFPPNYRLLNTAGELITDGGLIYTYAAGGSTPAATYSDAVPSSTLANPVVIGSSGLVDIWVTPGTSYRILVKTAAGVTLHDIDNVVGILNQSDITTLGNIATGTITASGAISGTTVTMSGAITSGGAVTGTSLVSSGAVTAATVTTTGAITGVSVNGVVEDSRATTVATPVVATATTSGTPAAGIGTGMLFKAESADENPSEFGQVDFRATDVTAGSEDTDCVISTRRAGAALAPAYKFRTTSAYDYIFTGAPTAERTITLPDTDISLSSAAGQYELITSTTLVSPTATVTFSSLTTAYSSYVLIMSNVLPATNGANLYLRVGTDNTTPITSGYSFNSWNFTSAPSTGSSGGNSAVAIELAGGCSNSSGNGCSGRIEIFSPMTTDRTTASARVTYGDGTNLQ